MGAVVTIPVAGLDVAGLVAFAITEPFIVTARHTTIERIGACASCEMVEGILQHFAGQVTRMAAGRLQAHQKCLHTTCPAHSPARLQHKDKPTSQ